MAVHLDKYVHLRRGSRVFQFASDAFDASVLDIVGTLIQGGCVCVPSETDWKNDLVKAVNEFQASWVSFTPSTIRAFGIQQMPTLKLSLLRVKH